jgi:serine/threonine protein kinase
MRRRETTSLIYHKQPEFQRAFETEIRALNAVRSENVIGLLDSFPDGYLVLEYMPHELHYLLEKQSPLPAQKKDICQKILRGLQHIHDSGWVHRDIKGSAFLDAPWQKTVLTVRDSRERPDRMAWRSQNCRSELCLYVV